MVVKWEYMRIDMYNVYDIDSFSVHGQEGWELVQIIPTTFSPAGMGVAVFKRPDPEFVLELQGAAQGYSFVQQP